MDMSRSIGGGVQCSNGGDEGFLMGRGTEASEG